MSHGHDGASGDELADECRRSVVDPVEVLDEQERGRARGAGDELADCLVSTRPAELWSDVHHLGGEIHLDIEGNRNEGQPGGELRRDRIDPLGEAGRGHVGRVVGSDAGQRLQRGADREVRGRARVLSALGRDEPELGLAVAQLLEQSGLPRAGLADDLDDPALARTSALGALEQDSQLCVAPEERQPALLLASLPGLVHDGRIDRRASCPSPGRVRARRRRSSSTNDRAPRSTRRLALPRPSASAAPRG